LTDFFFFLERTKFFEGLSSSTLQRINEHDIELYKKYLIGQQKSESTIQRRLSSLRTFFHACERAHLINHFPFPKQKSSPDTRPLLHVWKGHLQEKGLPVEMSHHVHEFLLWMHQKKKN
jgi:site-specific recombinase XerD